MSATVGKKPEKKPAAKKPDPKKEDAKEKMKAKRLALIKEELAKKHEEEERLKQKEQEEENRLEQIRLEKEENERLERERRERKKQKEKERKQRLKDEGKLLTDKQKQDRRRVQELVAARGLEIQTDAAEKTKKKPVYERLKRRPQQQSQEPTTGEVGTAATDGATPTGDNEGQVVSPTSVEEDQGSETDDWVKLADDLDGLGVRSDDDEGDEEDEAEDEDQDNSPDAERRNSREAPSEVSQTKQPQYTRAESDDDDPIEAAKLRIQARHAKFEAARSHDDLRSAVVCVLGHVDTGKTKILDKLRHTNVQDGEAGGITQQIGATNVPRANIIEATVMCSDFQNVALKLPGLLIIDTPGHESFSNMRSRGSSLCDIAILVVDIMHSLEAQTKESIRLLLDRKTPFVVALNKIDRLYEWQSRPNQNVKTTMEQQKKATINDFEDHLKQIVFDFAQLELNVRLFHENQDPREYVSMVPTSAHSGDGMGDLLSYLCYYAQTYLPDRLAYSEELQVSVMEVKEIQGLGMTIDAILVNGRLKEGDTIILAGQEGPIVTQVRSLLMPAPMKEFRVKNSYDHFKEVKGAQGVKIIAKDLEKALAGLPLYSSSDPNEISYYKDEVSRGLKAALKSMSVSEVGVYVMASTLGSLESLLVFLKSADIPYAGINIGPVHKRDVMKASVMIEREPKWAVILAFDIKIEREAEEMADSLGVRIFSAKIIYHLQDQMKNFVDDLNRANKEKFRDQAVFPCKLRILPNFVFNKRNPIVVGVTVESGLLRRGTPICVPSKESIEIGRVDSIEFNHKSVEEGRKGQEVCIRIEHTGSDAPKMYDRHFDHTDLLVSKISRESIDVVKEYFRDDLSKDDWKIMIELKKLLAIT